VRQPVDPVVGRIGVTFTDSGTYWTLVLGPWYSPRPMPDGLNALVAFVAEHQRCGDPDGEGRRIRLDRLLVRGARRAPG